MEFTLAEEGACDLDGVIYESSMPTQDLVKLGPSVLRYEEVMVFWIATTKYPEPDAKWLLEHFPSADEIVRGIETAFDEYYNEWCGQQMEQEILKTLSGDRLQAFKKRKWLDFVAVDQIFIHPDNGVIWLIVDVDSELDYNLSEHGVRVLRVDGEWKFGYSGAECDYVDLDAE